MTGILIFVLAAIAEIAGCFCFWAVFRLGKSWLWLLPGLASLIGFAYLLTLAETAHAGRTFAVYGGIYIAASLFWMRIIEGITPDRYDIIGGAIILVGAAIILYAPHAA